MQNSTETLRVPNAHRESDLSFRGPLIRFKQSCAKQIFSSATSQKN